MSTAAGWNEPTTGFANDWEATHMMLAEGVEREALLIVLAYAEKITSLYC